MSLKDEEKNFICTKSSDSNSFPLKEDRICVRYLRLAIHVTNYEIRTDSQTLDIWGP